MILVSWLKQILNAIVSLIHRNEDLEKEIEEANKEIEEAKEVTKEIAKRLGIELKDN